VSPLLFLLLFGILAYGIYFTDSLALRDGVRAAARDGSLQSWGPAAGGCSHAGTGNTGGNPSPEIQRLACNAVSGLGVVGGSSAIKIAVFSPGVNGYDEDGAWKQGGYIKVCAAVQQSIIIPFIPLPGNGLKHARVQMPIENDDPAGLTYLGGHDAPLPGDNWSWC
jgi:TadE-like protein